MAIEVKSSVKRQSGSLSKNRSPKNYSFNEYRGCFDNAVIRTTRKYRRSMRAVKHQNVLGKAQAIQTAIDFAQAPMVAQAKRADDRQAPRIAKRQAIAQDIDRRKPKPKANKPKPILSLSLSLSFTMVDALHIAANEKRTVKVYSIDGLLVCLSLSAGLSFGDALHIAANEKQTVKVYSAGKLIARTMETK